MKTLVAQPITPAAFAPFGQAFSASSLGGGVSANQGSAVRFDHCAKLLTTRPGAMPNLVVFTPRRGNCPLTFNYWRDTHAVRRCSSPW